MQPVIYHDFHVLVEVTGRKLDLFQQKPRHHELAIKVRRQVRWLLD